MEAMADDLNTPNAYAVIFEIVKSINQKIRVKEIDYSSLANDVYTLTRCMNVLGILLPNVEMSQEDISLYKEWMSAKANKDFEKADSLRAALTEKGIL